MVTQKKVSFQETSSDSSNPTFKSDSWPLELMKRVVSGVLLQTTNFDTIQTKSLNALSSVSLEYILTIAKLLKLEAEKDGRTIPNLLDFTMLDSKKLIDFRSLNDWLKQIKEQNSESTSRKLHKRSSKALSPPNSPISDSSSASMNNTDLDFLFGGNLSENSELSGNEMEASQLSSNAIDRSSSTSEESQMDVEDSISEFNYESNEPDLSHQDTPEYKQTFFYNQLVDLFSKDTPAGIVENYLLKSLEANTDPETNLINDQSIPSSPQQPFLAEDLPMNIDDEHHILKSDLADTEISKDDTIDSDQVLSMFRTSITNFSEMGIPLSDIDFSVFNMFSENKDPEVQERIEPEPESEPGNAGINVSQSQLPYGLDNYISSLNLNNHEKGQNSFLSSSPQHQPMTTLESPFAQNESTYDFQNIPDYKSQLSKQKDNDPANFSSSTQLYNTTSIDTLESNSSALFTAPDKNIDININSETINNRNISLNGNTPKVSFLIDDTEQPKNSNKPEQDPQNGAQTELNQNSFKPNLEEYALDLLDTISDSTKETKSAFSDLLTEPMIKRLINIEADDLSLPLPSLFTIEKWPECPNLILKAISKWIESSYDRENSVRIINNTMQAFESKNNKDSEVTELLNNEDEDPNNVVQKRSPYAGGISQDGIYQLYDRICLCASGFRDASIHTASETASKTYSGIFSNK
ncbi:hypothetical protein BB560_006967 [Smittium megazygosporum]|uniref:Bromodomain associated domain-containing protein n=1 Tax=Smittium megazygosporum TaxID=133381 RepID=A0A2T9XZV4_9FUNG|nr:hypothetical protein BB560_006967 [Smittium megazygosporum]